VGHEAHTTASVNEGGTDLSPKAYIPLVTPYSTNVQVVCTLPPTQPTYVTYPFTVTDPAVSADHLPPSSLLLLLLLLLSVGSHGLQS
jgi:hypothetical protein